MKPITGQRPLAVQQVICQWQDQGLLIDELTLARNGGNL
jgi:hypothetical protein